MNSLPFSWLNNLSQDTTLAFQKSGYNIYRCKKTGLHFVWPQPEDEVIKKIYGPEYFQRGKKYYDNDSSEAHCKNLDNQQEKLKVLTQYCSSGKLLDVGCAMGGFLHFSQKQGFEVEGVELSTFSAQYVRSNLGLTVHNSDLCHANLSSTSYDILTLWDVIEHLQSPAATLTEAYRLLRPGGRVFLTTGDIGALFAKLSRKRWHLLTPPQHLFYFTKQSICRALQDAGFQIEMVSHPGRYVPLSFLAFKSRELLGPLASPIERAIAWSNLGNLRFYINLFDIMTCVAKKPMKSSS